MAAILNIPLTPQPQTLRVTLGQNTYRFTFRYRNWEGAGWELDIADVQGNMLAAGLAVVTGAGLLEQLAYLGIPGELFIFTFNGQMDQAPGFADLGNPSKLFWVSP